MTDRTAMTQNNRAEAGVEEPEVERFDPNDYGVMIRNEGDGEWVRFSDHNTIVERLERELEFADAETTHFHALAVDDPGKNPPTLWRDIATTERERSARLREATQSILDAYDGGNLPYAADVRKARAALSHIGEQG